MNKRSLNNDGVPHGNEDKRQKPDELTASTAAAVNPPQQVLPAFHLMLHRHCIESIFKFLSLSELHQVLQVRKEWHLAVCSMGRIKGSFNRKNKCAPHSTSPLLRHVTEVEVHLTEYIPLLQLLPNLTTLNLSLSSHLYHDSNVRDAFRFPPLLTALTLRGVSVIGKHINSLLGLASLLTELKVFRLLPTHWTIASIDFKLLYPARKLTHFIMEFPPETTATDQQVEDLRGLPHQEILPCNHIDQQLALRLLKPPHQLKYKSLGDDRLSIDAGEYSPQWHEAIRNLPTLTKFKVEFDRSAAVVRSVANPLLCLQLLIELEHLELWDMHGHSSAETDGLNATELSNTLRQMHKLKCLQLHGCKLTSQHMAELLPQLPNLTDLKLFRCRNVNIDSLTRFNSIDIIIQQ